MESMSAHAEDRAFHRVRHAHLKDTERHRIVFGQYPETAGRRTLEMALVWHDLDGALHLRLESCADSWLLLATDERLRDLLGRIGGEIVAGRGTPSVGRIALDLRAAGFDDRTRRHIEI